MRKWGSIKYKLYRLQQRIGITSREAHALWVLLVFLLAGLLLEAHLKNKPAYTDETYAEIDSLFYDAIAGMRARADTTTIAGPAPDSSSADERAAISAFLTPAFPVNINTATAIELQRLPRIGPKMAERIIAYRTQHGRFQSPSALRYVKGIGEKTFAQLADKITTE